VTDEALEETVKTITMSHAKAGAGGSEGKTFVITNVRALGDLHSGFFHPNLSTH